MTVTIGMMVQAIRACPLVGRGTCSVIDECMSDADIAEEVKLLNSTAEAVEWARDAQELHLEQATNCRFGEDSDRELADMHEWEIKRKGN